MQIVIVNFDKLALDSHNRFDIQLFLWINSKVISLIKLLLKGFQFTASIIFLAIHFQFNNMVEMKNIFNLSVNCTSFQVTAAILFLR